MKSVNEMHWSLPLLLSLALSFGLISLSSKGEASSSHEAARSLHSTGDILSLEQVMQKLYAIKPGRVIEAEFEEEGGQNVYEFELADEHGEVWEYTFDAKTGELLDTERED